MQTLNSGYLVGIGLVNKTVLDLELVSSMVYVLVERVGMDLNKKTFSLSMLNIGQFILINIISVER